MNLRSVLRTGRFKSVIGDGRLTIHLAPPPRLFWCLLVAGLCLAPVVRAQQPSAPAEKPTAATPHSAPLDAEAQTLIRGLLSQQPDKLTMRFGEITIRTDSGKRFKVPLKYTIVPEEEGWRGIYEAQPTAWRGGERVEIIHRAGEPNRYLHFSAGAPGEAPKAPIELGGGQAAVAFAGSDYWLSDLGLEFLHWPEQRLLRDAKIKMRQGRSCKVIESVSPDPAATKYARVVSWLDAESGAPIYAEAYNAARQRVKTYSLRGFTKTGDHWQPKELAMLNEQTDSETRLEFSFAPP